MSAFKSIFTLIVLFVLAACSSTPQPAQPEVLPGTPTLTLSSNQDSVVLPQTLELAALFENLADKSVNKVEYFNGNSKIGETTSAPFGYNWDATSDNTGIAEGSSGTLDLKATASLSDGSSLSSNLINVQASAASAGFNLILEPTGIALENGQSASVKVKVTRLNGFSGDVTVSLVNPPTGVSAQALLINSGDTEGMLSVSAAGAAVGGPLEVMVKGESNGKSATAPLAVTIKPTPVAGAVELSFATDKAILTTPDTVNLTSNVSNLGGKTVNKVEFFRGATKIGEDTTAPYGMAWNATEQSTGVAAGTTQTVSLVAKATLSDNSIVTSGLQNISVTVLGAPKLEASLQPFSVSVEQGKSTSVFLSVIRTNIKGDVAVSLQNPPAGISLVPATVFDGSSGVLLVFKVDASTTVGLKKVTVRASIGNLSATTDLAMTVTAPVSSGSYTLSVVAGNLSIEQGKSAAILVKVNRIGGFTKDVKLFAGIIPPGVTATFTPSTLSGSETNSTLTLEASHDALAETPAQFAVFAQATGETVQVKTFTLTITGIHGVFTGSKLYTIGFGYPTISTRFTTVVRGPQNKFLLGAQIIQRNPSGQNVYSGNVLRLMPDGSSDTSFGMVDYGTDLEYDDVVRGVNFSHFAEITVTGLASLGDRIYVTGCARQRDYINHVDLTRQQFVSALQSSNGGMDKNFGGNQGNGTKFYPLYNSNTISCGNDIAANSTHLYTAGYINTSPMRIGQLMIDPQGTIDPSYNYHTSLNTVIPNTTGGSSAQATCVDGDKQYVGGWGAGTKRRSVVLAYSYAIGLLTSFSGDGIAAFDPDAGESSVNDLLCNDTGGKVIAAGYARTSGGKANFAVTRLDASGNLDKTFGGDGMVTTSFGTGSDVAVGLYRSTFGPNGGYVVAGYTTKADGTRDIALVKYNADGSLAQGFGVGGKVVKDLGGDEIVTDMADNGNGTIMVVGYTSTQGFVALFKV